MPRYDDTPEGMAAIERINREGLADPKAAVKHGLHLKGFFPCRPCVLRDECEHYDGGQQAECALEQTYHEQRAQALARLPHVDAELDWPVIVQAAWAEIRAARGQRWLAAVAGFLPGADRGVLEYRSAACQVRLLQKEARDALGEIGATPLARKKFGEKGEAGPAAENEEGAS